MGKVKVSEWLWRFLAAAILFSLGWTLWIFYQLNPPPLVTNHAFEAAARARANAKQSAKGMIAPAAAPEAPKEPPVNPERLKFSDSLSPPEKK